MTQEEFDASVLAVCPHCRVGVPRTKRADTAEHQHQINNGQTTSISICWATGLINSELNPEHGRA